MSEYDVTVAISNSGSELDHKTVESTTSRTKFQLCRWEISIHNRHQLNWSTMDLRNRKYHKEEEKINKKKTIATGYESTVLT